MSYKFIYLKLSDSDLIANWKLIFEIKYFKHKHLENVFENINCSVCPSIKESTMI